jgi:hypothetical protein
MQQCGNNYTLNGRYADTDTNWPNDYFSYDESGFYGKNMITDSRCVIWKDEAHTICLENAYFYSGGRENTPNAIDYAYSNFYSISLTPSITGNYKFIFHWKVSGEFEENAKHISYFKVAFQIQYKSGSYWYAKHAYTSQTVIDKDSGTTVPESVNQQDITMTSSTLTYSSSTQYRVQVTLDFAITGDNGWLGGWETVNFHSNNCIPDPQIPNKCTYDNFADFKYVEIKQV